MHHKYELLESSSLAKHGRRLISVDVVRGITVMLMILVDNLVGKSWPVLEHAEWDGFTIADVVFPSFLFIVGASIHLSMKERKEKCYMSRFRSREMLIRMRLKLWARVLLRFVVLAGLGILLNMIAVDFDMNKLRICHVLGRIATCYLVNALLYVLFPLWAQWLAAVGIFVIYAGLTFGLVVDDVPFCDRGKLTEVCSAQGYIDRQVLVEWLHTRLYRYGLYDPQGVLSTLTAILSTFLGLQFQMLASAYPKLTRRLLLCLLTSITCGGLGALIDIWWPINKNLWSPSFTLVTAGISGVALTLASALLDHRNKTPWPAKPFVATGRNALLCFVGMIALDLALLRITLQNGQTLWPWLFENAFLSWINPPELASFLFAVTHMIFWSLIAGILYRFRIVIKI